MSQDIEEKYFDLNDQIQVMRLEIDQVKMNLFFSSLKSITDNCENLV